MIISPQLRIKHIYLYCNQKTKTMATPAQTNPKLIRVRIYPFDFDGNKSNMTYVCYVDSIKEAKKRGWKYEIV